MKTLITATAITLASSAAFAGPYAGVEYNSTEINVDGAGSVSASGPRVYVGVETKNDNGRLYGEVGYYDYEADVNGITLGSSDDMDWKVGAELNLSEYTTIYGSYGSTDVGFADMNEAQVGIRFNF